MCIFVGSEMSAFRGLTKCTCGDPSTVQPQESVSVQCVVVGSSVRYHVLFVWGGPVTCCSCYERGRGVDAWFLPGGRDDRRQTAGSEL